MSFAMSCVCIARGWVEVLLVLRCVCVCWGGGWNRQRGEVPIDKDWER
jgi:hypothetical protein